MPETCVCCGEIIPEGRQVYPICEVQRDNPSVSREADTSPYTGEAYMTEEIPEH